MKLQMNVKEWMKSGKSKLNNERTKTYITNEWMKTLIKVRKVNEEERNIKNKVSKKEANKKKPNTSTFILFSWYRYVAKDLSRFCFSCSKHYESFLECWVEGMIGS